MKTVKSTGLQPAAIAAMRLSRMVTLAGFEPAILP